MNYKGMQLLKDFLDFSKDTSSKLGQDFWETLGAFVQFLWEWIKFIIKSNLFLCLALAIAWLGYHVTMILWHVGKYLHKLMLL